tara:strand:+ start:2111 stop:2212 length:102 start_codon:yes stop_codon:yes gene_type:complete
MAKPNGASIRKIKPDAQANKAVIPEKRYRNSLI